MNLISANSGYHNLQHNKKLQCITILHGTLTGIDSSDYHSEWFQSGTCSSERLMRSSDLQNVFGIVDKF